ncbi:MAG: hypothetical protein Fur0010_18350 [Bdellovibrio sp.]
MEKAEFRVWKLGEQVYSSSLKDEKDVLKIQRELVHHPKLSKFDQLPRALSERFQTELSLQKHMLNHNISILDLLNHHENLLAFRDPCLNFSIQDQDKKIYYQDMNCSMSEAGATDLINKSDLYTVIVSSPVSKAKGLLKDSLGTMNIEIVDKKNRVVNRGVCKMNFSPKYHEDTTIDGQEATSSFNSLTDPSLRITLADDLTLPLDVRLSDSKNRSKDEEAMDLHLGLGLERKFYFDEGRGFNISGGMEMPVLKGVRDVQGAMDPNNYSLRPEEMQFKIRIRMNF